MFVTEAKRNVHNELGRLGENEARVLKFYVKDILDEFPDASFAILHKRPGDEVAYPIISFEQDGKYLYWTIGSGDVAKVGIGCCELIATSGSVVVKTIIYTTKIDCALDGGGEPPEPWEGWVEQVSRDAASARQSAESASASEAIVVENAEIAAAAAETAVESKDTAVNAAERAEQAATTAGFMDFFIDDNGDLIYERTENLDIEFELDEGRLIALWPTA